MAWHVTKQLVTKGDAGDNNFVDGVAVTYETDSGITDTVFFRYADYNTENVRNTLAARVATHDQIDGLSG